MFEKGQKKQKQEKGQTFKVLERILERVGNGGRKWEKQQQVEIKFKGHNKSRRKLKKFEK